MYVMILMLFCSANDNYKQEKSFESQKLHFAASKALSPNISLTRFQIDLARSLADFLVSANILSSQTAGLFRTCNSFLKLKKKKNKFKITSSKHHKMKMHKRENMSLSRIILWCHC